MLALGQLYKVSQIKYSDWPVIAPIMVTLLLYRFQSTPGHIELRATWKHVRLVAPLSSYHTVGRDFKQKQYNISGLYKIFPHTLFMTIYIATYLYCEPY